MLGHATDKRPNSRQCKLLQLDNDYARVSGVQQHPLGFLGLLTFLVSALGCLLCCRLPCGFGPYIEKCWTGHLFIGPMWTGCHPEKPPTVAALHDSQGVHAPLHRQRGAA